MVVMMKLYDFFMNRCNSYREYSGRMHQRTSAQYVKNGTTSMYIYELDMVSAHANDLRESAVVGEC